MKKIIIFILVAFPFTLNPPSAKNIIQVGCGEYFTSYLTDEQKVYGTTFDNVLHNHFQDFGLTGVVEDIGAQYTNIVRLSDGTARIIDKNPSTGGPRVTTIPIDTFGIAFNGIQHVYGFWQSFLFIRHDSVYYLGSGNSLTYGSLGLGAGSPTLTKPMPLVQPAGRLVTKLVTFDNASAGMCVILALCSDGTVWQYFYGSATPTQKAGLSSIIDIAGITRGGGYVAITATDIKVWGPFTSYFGLSDGITTPTSVLSSFTSIGLVMPLKQAVSSWNTIHFIDASDNMFAEGDNMQGEIGNGVQYNNWPNYSHSGLAPYQWDFGRGQLLQGPIQITGKWTNLCGGSNIAFFFFGQGLCSNQWYSWGRNKEYALGNGSRINNDGPYPDWGIVPAPTAVSPSTVGWIFPEPTINPAQNVVPTANAGQEQCIALPITSLSAAYSNGGNVSISSYGYRQVSGPNTAGFGSPGSITTTLTGLITGTYTIVDSVVSSNSLVGYDTVRVNVSIAGSGNIGPLIRGVRISVH